MRRGDFDLAGAAPALRLRPPTPQGEGWFV